MYEEALLLELNNQELYCQVLGSIMKQPLLLHNAPSKITLDDFHIENKVCRAIFFAMNGIANTDVREIDCNMIISSPYLAFEFWVNKSRRRMTCNDNLIGEIFFFIFRLTD